MTSLRFFLLNISCETFLGKRPHLSWTFFTRNQCSGSTRYFGLSLYDNENDFYSLCTYERRTTYRSLSPIDDPLVSLLDDLTVWAKHGQPEMMTFPTKVVLLRPPPIIGATWIITKGIINHKMKMNTVLDHTFYAK